ncbi:Na+-driven multidrug efflux pump [Sphaerotilus hippei]|uniref:Na+-driven multidrug efflux pump n=1 Tax=Sphaerotilus hippei TaxID=744406 RepID=A0A318H782_9BURK|nr:MATE family efflux transporter [Sphaerotilus hippei]PXW95471.1 Na+-driven multidrug efflux pump [Sphaerotilus hippei]
MKTTSRPRLNAIAGPILGEFLIGMTVAMAGLWLASKTSDAAAGAFGMINQVLETLMVLFRVLAIGVGVVITQSLGGARPQAARQTALVGLGASTWAGLVAALWVLLANDWTLDVLNAPDAVSALASPYVQTLALALLLEAYNLTMAAILRAHLHARDTLMVMLVMHGIHLLLAFVLMRGVGDWDGLGLFGYAAAFTVSRAVGLGLHLWLWRRRMQLAPRARDWWVCPLPALMPVLRIGVPGAALEMAYRIAFMMSLAAAARLGVAALATQAYTLQTLKYVLLVSMAIGWACEIMVGHLIGAGEFRTAHRLVRKGLRNGLLASGSLALVAAAAAPWLMQAFTRDPGVIAAAQTLLWLSFALETGRVANLVVLGALRSTGDAVYPVAASITSIVLVLGVGSVVLGRHFGLPGIWVAYAADEWIRGMLLLRRWDTHGWVQHARQIYHRLRPPGAETRF